MIKVEVQLTQKQRVEYLKEWNKLQQELLLDSLCDNLTYTCDFDTFILLKWLRERYY